MGGQPVPKMGGQQYQKSAKLPEPGSGHRKLYLRQNRRKEPKDRPVDGAGSQHGDRAGSGRWSGGGDTASRSNQIMTQADLKAWTIIKEIIQRGNDAIVRKKGCGYIVLEDKREIKFQAKETRPG